MMLVVAALLKFSKICYLANRLRLAHLGGAELLRKLTRQKVDPPLEFEKFKILTERHFSHGWFSTRTPN